MRDVSIKEFEDKIGYHFKNTRHINIALTHSSYANEVRGRLESNERLEFLGDAILSLIVSQHIFISYPDYPEGELTKVRAWLVCEKSLCEFSKRIDMGNFLKLSHGEKNSGGSSRPSILADAFEAVVAAIYLDGGLDKAREFILRFIVESIENPRVGGFKDYKTMLQEIVQQNKSESLRYVLVSETGPDHDRHFVVEVHLNSNVIATGSGKSKKDAEQQAAKAALELMGY